MKRLLESLNPKPEYPKRRGLEKLPDKGSQGGFGYHRYPMYKGTQ